MKLTIVGPASAYSTIPGQSSSSYLVEEGETAILLDLGQGSFAETWRYISPNDIAAVVISHMHADHNVDLVPLRHWARYRNERRGPAIFGPSDLRPRYADFQMPYSEPSTKPDFFEDLGGDVLSEGEFVIGSLRIDARHVTHIPDAYGFRVSAVGGSGAGLVYSGDCGVADDLLPLIKPGDVLLAEAGFGVRRIADGIHLTAGEAGAVAQRAGAARLVLTHCASGVAPDDLIAAARAEFSGPVEIAQPGLTLDIS